jgi:hypothetical protein
MLTTLLVAGATVAVIGPKELPGVARKLGFAVGRSLGVLRGAKRAVRQAAQDPEIVGMTQEVEKGLEDIRKIRAEMQSLSAKQAKPYLMGKVDQLTQPEEKAPEKEYDLPKMPPLSNRIYSPAHTDKARRDFFFFSFFFFLSQIDGSGRRCGSADRMCATAGHCTELEQRGQKNLIV